VAEEQDDGTHEIPTSQDQKAMSLFYCPVKGCIKMFLRSSTLQHHMIFDEHVIQSKKETIYERTKQGYAKRLEEGSYANAALQTKFEVFQGENNLKQGWGLKSCKSRAVSLFSCVKYQLNLKTKKHLLQMKIKDLRSKNSGLKAGKRMILFKSS